MMRDILLMVVMCTGTCLAAPMAGAETAIVPSPPTQEHCDGALKQGGLVICHGVPGTVFTVAGRKLTADASGSAQFGLATDAPSVIGWSSDTGAFGDLAISARSRASIATRSMHAAKNRRPMPAGPG